MSTLRPKYQLNKTEIQGDRITIPAEQFTKLTTRRYPYPRVGTRAPDGMFPYKENPGNLGLMKPHYTLNKAAIQGVIPYPAYATLTGGKLTTQPDFPTYVATDSGLALRMPPRLPVAGAPSPVRAPALVDWGAVFGGFVAGGLITLLMVYGVIPALAEWGAAVIKRRY